MGRSQPASLARLEKSGLVCTWCLLHLCAGTGIRETRSWWSGFPLACRSDMHRHEANYVEPAMYIIAQ